MLFSVLRNEINESVENGGMIDLFFSKDNLSRVNGLQWGGYFDEKAAFQVVSDKIPDDTGNAKPGSGEFNQKIHCCNLNQIGGMNVIFLRK